MHQPPAGPQIVSELGFRDPQTFDEHGNRFLVVATQGAMAVGTSFHRHGDTISL